MKMCIGDTVLGDDRAISLVVSRSLKKKIMQYKKTVM